MYQVFLHEHHQGLSFWVSKAGIVFQYHWTAFSEHDVRVEYTGEVDATRLESLQCCGNDISIYLRFGRLINERQRGECSHSSSIQPLIAIKCAFVILGQC